VFEPSSSASKPAYFAAPVLRWRSKGEPRSRQERARRACRWTSFTVIPAQAQGCPGKGPRLGPAVWLAFNTAAPRRPIAVNPPRRLEGTRNTMSARAAPWRVLRLRSAPSGDRDRSAWLLVAKRPRWRRGVRDLLSRARSLLSLARQKPANKLGIALFRDGRAPGVKFALIFPGQPCAQARIQTVLGLRRRGSLDSRLRGNDTYLFSTAFSGTGGAHGRPAD